MYQSKRARLGSSLTLSPYEAMKQWVFEHLSAMFLSVVYCFCFFGFLYVVSTLVVFFGGRSFMNLWDEEEGVVTVTYIYARPWMELIRWIGCILIFVITFRIMNKKR